jgi:hypothetical protein
MLGREPRLPHSVMRWLIIAMMLLNGVQLVMLQLAINSSALYDVGQTWLYVALSGAALLLAGIILLYAFLRERNRKSR